MFKPIKVKAMPDYKLWVKYADGVEGIVDLSHLVGKGVFSLWNDYRNFLKVYIGNSGEIAWSDKIDICPDSIYMRITGKTPEQLFPDLKEEVVSKKKRKIRKTPKLDWIGGLKQFKNQYTALELQKKRTC